MGMYLSKRTKYVIEQSQDGQFYYVLKAANNEVLNTSEMYPTKRICRKGIAAARWASLWARIVDNTKKVK